MCAFGAFVGVVRADNLFLLEQQNVKEVRKIVSGGGGRLEEFG